MRILLRFRLRLTELECRRAGACILPKVWRSQIIFRNVFTCDGMLVVEGHHTRIRPQHRVLTELIWTKRILWERGREERDIVGFGIRPALFEGGMPEGEVLQPEDLPYAILLYVFVFVDASLPPLNQAARMRVLDALVCARSHHAAKAPFGTCAVIADVNNALNLRMVEEKAVDGSIAALDKSVGKTSDIQALHPFFAIVTTAEELDTAVRVV